MKSLLLFILAILFMVDLAKSANILVMLPLPLYSHTNNYMPIFKALAARGHNVTMVSPFPQKKPIPNFTDIAAPNITKAMLNQMGKEINFVELDGIIFDLVGLWVFGINLPTLVLESEELQRLIKDTDSKFDLVMTETWFIQEPFVAFGYKFNAPVINLASTFIPPQASYLTGNHLPPSYVNVLKLPYTDHMSFVQRLWNSFYYYWEVIMGNIYLWQQNALMKKYFVYPGSENLPPLIDMLRNTSLTLMDSNFAINYPVPLQKNVIEFGGININMKAEKLPTDIQKFMDSATEGVIYFSFGSYIKVSSVKAEVQKALVTAFGKLKQKVIMKMEPGNPYADIAKPNILIRKWFPQASILAHQNCKLFVTHGGLHGTMEGVYNAVPMVAIPLIADQKFNAKFIENTGIGKLIRLPDVTEENLLLTIDEVLKNPSYCEKAKERSAIFKDKPMNTLDNVIYWIEYVIRHKGAPHLRPASVDLYWFQYFLLDVIAFYIIILILIVFILKFILVSIFNCTKWLISGKSVDKKSKKKKE